MVKGLKRILTVAGGMVVGWLGIQLIRLLIYTIAGLIFWEWDFGLWFSNEFHRIYDFFMYGIQI